MRLSSRRWLGPIPAAFVLQAIFGLLFANGVFVAILNSITLTRALGLAALFTSVGITFFGILLHHASSDTATYPNADRLVAVTGSVCITAQALMAYGLYHNISSLVYLGASLVGTGSGCIFVVSVVILQSWVPESPAFATGLGLLLGGAGSLFGIYAFQVASDMLGGAIPAIALAGLLSGIVSVCAAWLIERPPSGWSPLDDIFDEQHQSSTAPHKLANFDDKIGRDDHADPTSVIVPISSDETEPLLPHKEKPPSPPSRLSIADILADPAFSLVFLSVCAAVGPGFGFVLAFPKMVNTLFGIDLIPANQLFFWVTFVGVAGRVAIGVVIDVQSSVNPSKNGFIGAKWTNTALLALQSLALAALPICIRLGWLRVFAFATAMVYITFSGGAVVSACLARSIFSPENSTLAFALLGVAIGIGRALFSLIIASCGQTKVVGMMRPSIESRIYEYDLFVQVALVISLVGLVSSLFVTPSKAAYDRAANSPV